MEGDCPVMTDWIEWTGPPVRTVDIAVVVYGAGASYKDSKLVNSSAVV